MMVRLIRLSRRYGSDTPIMEMGGNVRTDVKGPKRQPRRGGCHRKVVPLPPEFFPRQK